MRRDSKKGKIMHSVSVYPCLSEAVCAHSFCMRLHCFDMLSHNLYVSVCPCLIETVCAHTFCMELHCFDMLTHGLSMSVCPCLSETVCARSSCMQLHCFDMLSHSLSVSVYPCLSETMCARTFCMRLHCFVTLPCPYHSTGKVLRPYHIYWRPFFCGSWWRKPQKDLRKSHKSPFVLVLNTTLCSLDFNISVVRTSASNKGLERR